MDGMDVLPPAARPLSARPQSHRFISQGLAQRPSRSPEDKEEWRPMSAASTQISAQSRSEMHRQISHWCASELERFRQSFQEDVANSLTALKEALAQALCVTTTTTTTTAAPEQTTERDSELRRARAHIEELLKLNTQLRQQTLDLMSREELDRFRGCISETCDSMRRLLEKQQRDQRLQLRSCAEEAAEKAADMCVQMVQKEWPTLKEMWLLWRREDEARWGAYSEHLERLERQLLHSSEALSAQLAALEAKPQLQGADLQAAEQRICDKVAEVAAEVLKPYHLQSLQAEVTSLALAAREAAVPVQEPTSGPALEDVLEDQLLKVRSILNDEVLPRLGPLEHLSQRLEDALKVSEMEQEVLSHQHQAETAWGHCRRFEVEMSDLRLELQKMKAEAQDESKAKQEAQRIQRELLRKVRQIEQRGNLHVKLQSGDVEVVQGLDFVAKKNDATAAQLSDAGAGARAMADLKELQELLDAPMVIEGHVKGGNNKHWQTVAENRAKLIQSELIKRGLRPEDLATKGLPGNKGVNRPCVMVRVAIPQE